MAPTKASKNLYKLITGPVSRDESGQIRELNYIVEVKEPKKKPACYCMRTKAENAILDTAFGQMLADLPKDTG